jgi:hypothetical protein
MTNAKQKAIEALEAVLVHVDHLTIDFKNTVEKEIAHLNSEIALAGNVQTNTGVDGQPIVDRAELGNVTTDGIGATAQDTPADTTAETVVS